jgi:ABC-type Fe2+-enterobactin transport system substrate-binding protein
MVNSTTEDNLEQQYLDHFSTYTAPTLTGNFSPDFWQSKVLQAAQVEPSIRHACIAIAAVHHDFEKKQNVVAESNCTLQAFAFRHYTMAISHLHSLMSTTQRLDMTLITCILFICFDCLLGNQ